MIKVTLVCVGKIKEKYFAEGVAEYVKRLSAFCDFKIIETEEENYKKVDDAQKKAIKQKEGERILSKLSGKVYAMEIEGKKYSSESFARLIQTSVNSGENVTFVIGGSYGLSDEVKKRAEGISFSDMTFPHTLFRLMFCEQIYRAFSIIGGKSYHK